MGSEYHAVARPRPIAAARDNRHGHFKRHEYWSLIKVRQRSEIDSGARENKYQPACTQVIADVELGKLP
jgi:hypothetical protein